MSTPSRGEAVLRLCPAPSGISRSGGGGRDAQEHAEAVARRVRAAAGHCDIAALRGKTTPALDTGF